MESYLVRPHSVPFRESANSGFSLIIRPVRIAVNLLPFRERLAGAGRYSQNILRELLALDTTNEYVFFVAPRAAPHFAWDAPNVTQVLVSLPEATAARLAAEQTILPVRLAQQNVNTLFTPSVAMPVVWRGKSVTVIYDMMAEHGALEKYPPLRSAYVRWMSRYAARRSDAVITISENSRREIARFAGVPPEKIRLAPPAANLERVTDTETLARVRETYRLPERFILYVGTLEPAKNLPMLVRAYARLKRAHPEVEQHLVLAGAGDRGVREIEDEIAKSNASGFHMVGFVAQEDLAAIYSLADVFVYPSRYEGFGMPPLEAMACGTPVIVSNVASLPEVLGTPWSGKMAGLMVPPQDEQGWADALASVLTDGARRERLGAAGLGRAREFSWKASAQVILDALGAV